VNIDKRIAIAIATAIGLLLIIAAKIGLSAPSSVPKVPESATINTVSSKDSNQVNLVSTSPSPLDQATILPNQTITITFDQPAQNAPELKVKIDPQIDINTELSDDRKTLKVSPKTTFGLKQGYTLTIPTEAKFDGDKKLDHDLIFHFTTIDYQGV